VYYTIRYRFIAIVPPSLLLSVLLKQKKIQVYLKKIEFSSITEEAEFLEVTISFLSRCVREGKPCRGGGV